MPASVPAARRRLPWWRLALPLPFAGFATFLSYIFSEIAQTATSADAATPGAIALRLTVLVVSVGYVLLLLLRAALPRTVLATATVVGALLPYSPAVALVCLPGFIDRLDPLDRPRPRIELALAIGLTTATAIAAAVRDAVASSHAASFSQLVIAAGTSAVDDPTLRVEVPLWYSLVSVVLPVGVAVGLGLLRRAARAATAAEARSEQLGDELLRRSEREALSREVHDALGHRLSLLNLQAGALEAQAGSDPALAAQAAQLRENASQSMGDLRSLLDQLDRRPAPLPLAELHRIVAGATGPADAVRIEVDAHASASPELARAAVRIVQECLTNARKHAPGSPLRLEVLGAPGAALRIHCSNWLPPQQPFAAPVPAAAPAAFDRGGRGLPGMAERTRLLGGTCIAGAFGPEFRVQIALPWPRPA